jgi:hypothetical protein
MAVMNHIHCVVRKSGMVSSIRWKNVLYLARTKSRNYCNIYIYEIGMEYEMVYLYTHV